MTLLRRVVIRRRPRGHRVMHRVSLIGSRHPSSPIGSSAIRADDERLHDVDEDCDRVTRPTEWSEKCERKLQGDRVGSLADFSSLQGSFTPRLTRYTTSWSLQSRYPARISFLSTFAFFRCQKKKRKELK